VGDTGIEPVSPGVASLARNAIWPADTPCQTLTYADIDRRLIWHADGTEASWHAGKAVFRQPPHVAFRRVQARYTAPDGRTYAAPVTFDSRQYAEAFLARTHGDIQAGRWQPPHAGKSQVRAPGNRDVLGVS
jgi:hypothetical protein